MHCYVFGMYLKDGPLRRSSECIAMYSECVSQRRSLKKEFRMHCYVFGMYLKDGPLRSSDYIFTKCMLQYFAGNIERQGGEG